MKAIVATLLLAVSTVGAASTGLVGTTEFTIPAPAGFTPATAEMEPLYSLLATFVADTNGELVSFLERSEADEALQGGIPEMRRRFSAQYALATADAMLSARSFDEVKQAAAAQNAAIAETINDTFPHLLDRANEGLADLSATAQVMSISEVVPLPPHEDDEQRFSYSAYVTFLITDEAGNAVPFVSLVNATLLRLRGKLVILYAFGGEDDLEWARTAGTAWTTDVINANPGPDPIGGEESVGWHSATMRGLITGFIVGVVLVVLARARKRG